MSPDIFERKENNTSSEIEVQDREGRTMEAKASSWKEISRTNVPWFTHEIQKAMDYRHGDIVCSAPPKSGTTWTMNIVHQLRSNGDDSFVDIHAEVPWVELIDRPGRKIDDLVEMMNSMPKDRRRAFKTHSAPPDIPYIDLGMKDVKYIVVARNPDEAIASFKPFVEGHTDEFFEMWDIPPNAFKFPNFQVFYDKFIVEREYYKVFFEFLEKWWPLRNKANVLLVHFSDLKREHDGTLRKIADFLGFQPHPEAWDTIKEYTTFQWMKKNEDKFEISAVTPIKFWKKGKMMRKGEIHKSREDGITETISKDLAERGRKTLKNEDAFAWLYHGDLGEPADDHRGNAKRNKKLP